MDVLEDDLIFDAVDDFDDFLLVHFVRPSVKIEHVFDCRIIIHH